ncbi:MAG: LysM peptidoglycan-binding domain-containing protein [Leptolyngbya sp. SIO1E4]|nr:LysM peptidoglycan-binding domain-containing protein [Leptolyngbya sp. SIO1E4]
MIWGKLEKLKIKSFPTAKRQEGVFSFLVKTYEVMFNPESYSFQYENEYQKYQGINTSGRTARYSLTRSRTLSLKFVIDDSSATAGLLAGTSAIGPFSRKTVYKRVEEFLDFTARMDGELHQPKYLRLEWGDLIFDCRLQSVDVNYTLFNRSGTAIRAELDTTFVEDIEASKRLQQEGKNSPDLTHTRTITSGDTLPLMAHRIYRDPNYYMRVAQANKLNNFRKLKAGTTLNFPPVKHGGE